MNVADAYSRTGAAWQGGPGRLYDRLAERLVAMAPVPVRGRVVVDLGAGTGAASRALAAAGAEPVALDAALGMLVVDRFDRPPAVVGDACALPFGARRVGGVVAAFSLNHVTDPAGGLRECVRVCAPGSPIVASAYAEDDTHPAKAAAETAAREHGWAPEPWYDDVRRRAVPLLATVDRAEAVCAEAGLDAEVRHLRVPFPELGPVELLAWRFGMAQLAPFFTTLTDDARASAVRRAMALLGPDCPPLERSIIVISATA